MSIGCSYIIVVHKNMTSKERNIMGILSFLPNKLPYNNKMEIEVLLDVFAIKIYRDLSLKM